MNIRELLSSKAPSVGNTLFIAVDGHGGSGKSTFAKLLAKKLGAEIVQTDYFASWDNPLNWWPLVIQYIFEPIKKGATTLSYPKSQWTSNHKQQPVLNQPVTSIMILEGVSAMRKEFQEYIGFSIFVDTPKNICLQQGVKRDLAYGYGKSRSELVEMWNQWFEEEEVYFWDDNPKPKADLIIDGTKPFEKQIS